LKKIPVSHAIAYAAALDPLFLKRIRGASEAEVMSLEKMCGRRLPAAYREFLLALGKDAGGLEWMLDGQSDFDSVFSFYRDEISGKLEDPPPPDVIVMALCGSVPSRLWLSPSNNDDPPVYSADLALSGLYARSLGHLICNEAFSAFRMRRASHFAYLHQEKGGTPLLEKGREILLAGGFSPLFFSDETKQSFELKSALVRLVDTPCLGRTITFAYGVESDIRPIFDALKERLGLRIISSALLSPKMTREEALRLRKGKKP
jgi:hypothetical protein